MTPEGRIEGGAMSETETFVALLVAAGAALAVFHFSRPSSGARAVLFTLFIAATALAAIVLSLHGLLSQVAGGD
jgi:hypothetical protein